VRICALGIGLGILYSSIGNYLSVATIDRIWHDGMFQVIDYLKKNAANNSIIQCTNIGIVGYYTEFYILDPFGLASPSAVSVINSADSLPDLQRSVAASFRPDYIVSFGVEDYEGYEQVAEYPTSDISLILYQALD
jgi:hypothetical protein